MNETKKTVLLTGPTGNMGRETLKQLYASKKYNLVLFSMPDKLSRVLLARYEIDKSVKIIWGDLTNFNDVQKAAAGADIVLHVGALVSPAADRQPELAWKVNFIGTKNIVDAISQRKDKDNVKLVYIGTVAETGNRAVPVHWGRVGDPLVPSAYDYYALSKIAAERYVIESGLKRWVSLRQTGILHCRILYSQDGTGFHQPLNNHLEWVTAHDSGRLMLNVCSDDVPGEFWNNVYNIGGGETCRLTAYEFCEKMFRVVGVKMQTAYEPNMFALRNFHGQYYLDSDVLENYLHFRSQSVDDMLGVVRQNLSPPMKAIRFLVGSVIKRKMTRDARKNPIAPLYWIEHNDESKIKAFFGKRENWENIKGWDECKDIGDPAHIVISHGYDESKNNSELTLDDVKQAAEFRGGKCVSDKMNVGDMTAKLQFRCAHGHEFWASPYLVLKTGHWCTECIKPPWNFDEQAKKSPFIAQVYYADHSPDENNIYE